MRRSTAFTTRSAKAPSTCTAPSNTKLETTFFLRRAAPTARPFCLSFPYPMTRSRRVQRVHLALPVTARFGSTQVVVVDISVLGARIEHHVALGTVTGATANLACTWDDEDISVDCRVVRSRLERFPVGLDGLTIDRY